MSEEMLVRISGVSEITLDEISGTTSRKIPRGISQVIPDNLTHGN